MNKAIFLDRDGTINQDSINYIKNISEFKIFSFSIEALKILRDRGYKLIIITNQSSIARKYISLEELDKIHQSLKDEAAKQDVRIDAIYICPHHPDDNCECRKPKIKNVLRAVEEHNIDLEKSYFIGDTAKDIETGKRSGCQTILVQTGKKKIAKAEAMSWKIPPNYIVENLLAAAILLQEMEDDGNL